MNLKCLCSSVFFVLVMALSANTANAAGFRLPNQNAFATARGNAFVATADNASAIYYNPAGIAQISGTEAEVGFYAINFAVDAERSSGNYSNNDKIQFVPQAYYASANEDWGWGIGLYAPFGLGNEWPDGTDFTSITTEAEIKYLTLSPVFSKEVSPGINLGFGLTFNYADADLEQGVGFFPNDRFRYRGDDIGIGLVAGLLWHMNEKHRMGLSFRSGVKHDLDGTSTVSFDETIGDSELKIDIPAIINLGYAYQYSPSLDFEFNLEWGQWSKLDQVTINDTPILGGVDIPINFDWENNFIYQFGFTKRFEKYALSAGYDYNKSVQTETYYTPSVADANRHWFNVGVSVIAGDRLPWTLTYQYGTSDRTVTESLPNMVGETGNGTYEVEAHSISFTYEFDL